MADASVAPENQRFHAAFWDAYGPIEQTQVTRFRKMVYEAIHAGTALVWAKRNHDQVTLQRAMQALREVAAALPAV